MALDEDAAAAAAVRQITDRAATSGVAYRALLQLMVDQSIAPDVEAACRIVDQAVAEGKVLRVGGQRGRVYSGTADAEGPDHGHLFRLAVTSTMSSRVVGEPHHRDADWESDPWTVQVRAWSLPEAMRKAADLPLSAWGQRVALEHRLRREPAQRTENGGYRAHCRCGEPFEAANMGAAHDLVFAHARWRLAPTTSREEVADPCEPEKRGAWNA